MLSCFGARCCTRTKPMLESSGRAARSCSNASSPPADAPTPTMETGSPDGCAGGGKFDARGLSGVDALDFSGDGGRGREFCCLFFLFIWNSQRLIMHPTER